MSFQHYLGAAKAEIEIQRLTAAANSANACESKQFQGKRGILHLVTRQEIETGDVTRIATGFGPRIPGDRLEYLEGRTSLVISGYDQDERELYEIPEVRGYLIDAFRRCPALIHSADLRNDCFRIAIFCVLPNLIVVRRQGDLPEIHIHEEELSRFFMGCLRGQCVLHKRLGWSRTKGVKQLRTLADYLGIYEP